MLDAEKAQKIVQVTTQDIHPILLQYVKFYQEKDERIRAVEEKEETKEQ